MRLLLVLSLLTLVGCPETPPGPPTPPPPPVVDDGLETMAQSTRNALVWKRNTVLSRALAAALLVPEEDLCNELGRFNCARFAHIVPLGGNDAFGKGQHEPLAEPGATTAVSFDRFALSACSVAVEIDRGRPAPFLFRGVSLSDAPLNLNDAETELGARALTTELYARLHARAPRAPEIDAVVEMLTDDDGAAISGRDFAKLACFAIASTTETLFY